MSNTPLSPVPHRVHTVAVIGSATAPSPELEALCRTLGDALMHAGWRLVTGGCGGVMAAVSRGARHSTAWQEGRILGIVPSYQHSQANPYCDIVIPSGLQLGRNVLVVSSAAVVIALDGGAGTLSEIAMAWQLGRPVIALTATGWAGELAGRCLDARSDRAVIAAANVAQAIAHCRSLLDSGIGEAADIGTGWRTRTAGTTEREVTP
jgi:uncharacterized protein (TIGR00725 family)